ncbi:hypothetical protein [Chromobacterium violaceum]|uniref:Uncharacterized protein n=1 Tax=Chromobacterium violaceum (strain ATCC 12472 / DSM 30191 / JCM 1249 / CCUG 213 / NBRC 12614 / NCIMB 9131 / NCTC 9757 / MK) TaxID=243365 RepID=Q7NW64_CHRVO|nr:hypothetical protein [Chromobacterium violaceum]AAQ59799.1 hypothetical protein CV_2126 [Chromobacterium violaceum ATCC 12472]SUX35337.1 Uncharacterised protein [Chromobacterium violaceum]
MRRLAWIALCLPFGAQAGNLFDGYEAYYTSLPGQLFRGGSHELEPFSREGSEDVIYGWKGRDAGQQHAVELRDGRIKIDGKAFPVRSVKPFPDEVVNAGDLGRGAEAYFAPGWACIEGTPPSASGTAARHKSVYLIQLRKRQAWKLPTLFASCLGVRIKAGLPAFDKVQYRYQDGNDEPAGVTFTEYAIKGGMYVEAGNVRSAAFVEAGNVYKFTLGP